MEKKNSAIDRRLFYRHMRPTLSQVMYAIAVLGASLALLGPRGALLAFVVLVTWLNVRSFRWHENRTNFACGVLSVAPLLLFLFMPLFNPPASAGGNSQHGCRRNLAEISFAISRYHGDHNSYPPAYIADSQGKPMHSWRVLLLPYLGEQGLYDDYDFNQPWNGPHNLKLAQESAPAYYVCPSQSGSEPSIHTSYFAIVGENAAQPGSATRRGVDFLPDGLENTVVVLEDHSRKVLWTEPSDLSAEEAIELISSSDYHTPHDDWKSETWPRWRNALCASGRSKLYQGTSAADATAIVTINDGKALSQAAMQRASQVHQRSQVESILKWGIFLAIALWPAASWLWRRSRGQGISSKGEV